ncbi:MAG: TetR/AcrR family transcriptional regulator [Solirubrobacterales bacterium]
MIIAPGTRKRTRLSPEARREQLVEIGAQLFAERPFNDVWIEEVAKEAGVSRGLVYHYFPNKRDFYSAIVSHGLKNAFELSAPDPEVPPERWLLEGIEHIFDYAKLNENAFRAVYLSRHTVDDAVREAIREGRELQVERICEFVTPGEPPSKTMLIAMDSWSSMLDAMILEWLDGRATDRDKLVRLAAGSLAGTIVTTLVIDGRGELLAKLGHLTPAIF